VEPDNKNLLLYYVLIMRELDEYDEAEGVMREALEKNPNDERLMFNLGLVLHEGGSHEEALALMERVLTLNPKNSDAMNYLAYGLVQKGADLDRAQRLSQQALEVRPNDPFYLDTLGWIQFKRGKIADAEETLGRAMSYAGEDVVIIDHYTEALVANGKFEKAAALMKAAIELKLEPRDADDADTKAALSRINNRLKELVRTHPELAHVEKTALMKKAGKDQEQTSFEFDSERLSHVVP
jgi:Flp pilus assembly protein TadD